MTGTSPLVRGNGRAIASYSTSLSACAFARWNAADLAHLARLIESGAGRPVVDRTDSLERTADAVRHVASGHAGGKVVISMGEGRVGNTSPRCWPGQAR